MTPQQRREYIAEKIFRAKKKFKYITWLHVPGKEFHPPFDWQFPDGRIVDSKTNFESLPEWTGPICDVVLPMIAKKGWHMSFLFNGHVDICDSESWAILDIPPAPLSTVLIDIHIKTQENELIFS
ncbi:hypothetical protein QMM42_17225 [Leptospira santarosai]|uniref:hypothetical protein n=1 Tax=Leptospira santarosai TaxID=28183 RepID=UPI0024AFDE13|nr:hypothetical protein [Leptospira santarosai]MDI7187915.1 hypothetical protein [Leptospira santarosai]